MLRVILALAALLFFSSPASSHGEFSWIMEKHYIGNDGVHCCGPADCDYISEDMLTLTNAGYVLHYKGQDYLFNQWGRGLHVTERPDKPPVMCRSIAYDTPRCIFIKPLGS